jgi:hypothetical protein
MDYGRNTMCCQRASPHDLEYEQMDCDTCEVNTRMGALDPVNAEAWTVYTALMCPVVSEMNLHAIMFENTTSGWSPDERVDCLYRLDLIRSILSPSQAPASHGN